jgi:formate hydrogenlyase subunit 6/NADH:ubiquinone oxidoreductase subunit I
MPYNRPIGSASRIDIMVGHRHAPGETVVVDRPDLPALLESLIALGYDVVGPTIREDAIVYDRITSVEQLPIGWTDVQDAGTYRLERRTDAAVFGYVVGPHSWKKFLHVPWLSLWRARRDGTGFVVDAAAPAPRKLALLGVRGCELSAIAIQDRVLAAGPHPDPQYVARREQILTIAVNCTQAGGTCFCVSMQTGPRVGPGFDLALTELLDGDGHAFLVEIGSEAGARVMQAVPCRPAEDTQRTAATTAVNRAATQMGRHLDTRGIKELLYAQADHPRWDDVAARCLGCANCTMVCPTCFCTSVEDVTDLTGDEAERVRRWDSCFTMDFSYLNGGHERATLRARYRQWLTHKLASWIDQFGTSGCVGCGRCITWCPVGIDITEEVRALGTPGAGGAHGHP